MDESATLDPAVIDTLRNLTPPGEPDVLCEVLQMFLAEMPPRLDRLRNAFASGDIEELRRTAHSLKGSAGNIGANRLFVLCRQLDDQGKTGDLSGAQPLIDALGVEFGKVEVEIHRIIGA